VHVGVRIGLDFHVMMKDKKSIMCRNENEGCEFSKEATDCIKCWPKIVVEVAV
jgi:hypothetical protein